MKNILLLSLIATIISCSTAKMDGQKDARLLISYSQGPCFGQCPVYSLDIYTDGRLDYHGKQFVKREGTFMNQLSQKEYASLLETINKASLYDKADLYDEMIMDASIKTMIYHGDNGMKKIIYKFDVPEEMQNLEKALQGIAMNKEGYAEYIADPAPDTSENVEKKLIVNLAKDTDTDKWLKKYQHLNLQIERALSPNGLMYLMTFDQSFDENRIMEELRRDADVTKVQLHQASSGTKDNKHNKVKVRKGTKEGLSYETFEFQEGDTTYLMKKYYMMTYLHRDNRAEITKEQEQTLQAGHMAHLNELAHQKKICIAGPTDGTDEVRGFVLYNVYSMEEAIELTEKDPMVKQGRFKYTISPWWAAVGSTLF